MIHLKTQPIRIPPNTGHHYQFVEFPLPVSAEIRDICSVDRSPWIMHPEFSWVRHRFTVRADAAGKFRDGILFAVESNTGDAKRGWLYKKTNENHQPVSEQTATSNSWYVFSQADQIDGHDAVKVVQIDATHPVTGKLLASVLLEVHFLANAGSDPIDVDLIVDFGNTRTIALLLEASQEPQSLSDHCYPVRFMPRMAGYENFTGAVDSHDPMSIADSWIVLHETPFADLLPPNDYIPLTKIARLQEIVQKGVFTSNKMTVVAGYDHYLPQMFVEYAPVIMGGGIGEDSARSIMGNPALAADLDANYFLSSPKRYAWDRDQVGSKGTQYWNVQPNKWNPVSYSSSITKIPELQGPLLMLMSPNGSRAWNIHSSPLEAEPEQRPHADDKPKHPRCETMTWSALAVLEMAKRQINSPAYRQRAGNPMIPRRIRKVIVTFPSGWTLQEFETYREQWQKAISIFTISHYQNRNLVDPDKGDQPELSIDLDEAVASQLPIIYSEINNLGKSHLRNNWLYLTGRSAGDAPRVRVMNIDIGGGTTDISVIEYWDTLQGPNVCLDCQVLFKNSMTIAGDALVKRIIERALLPSIVARVDSEDPQVRAALQGLFDGSIQLDGMGKRALRGKMARILRLVFVPIINHWLSALTQGTTDSDELLRKNLNEISNALGEPLIEERLLAELNHLLERALLKLANRDVQNVVSATEPFSCSTPLLEKCIEEVFRPVFRTLSRICAAFDCDLVLVSGKPSELPQIRTLLNRIMPILPQRIIFANDYPVGDWYPVGAKAGKIKDAKSPTVVGAALYVAMTNNMIRDWTIRKQPPQLTINRNDWGIIPANPSQFQPFLTSLQKESTLAIQLGSRIGRKRFSTQWLEPEPVYEFRLAPGVTDPPKGNLFNCTFLRAGTPESGEELLLTHVCTLDNATLDPNQFELRLNTLLGNEFWMDSPRFQIDYGSE